MNGGRTLDAVRKDIDAIDDTLHDLIIRRTRLVEEVRAIKHGWPVKIQPSREAEILCRRVAEHAGPFPKRDLCAIWRQLITATISFEGPFSVAVYVNDAEGDCWDQARDHFGAYVSMSRMSTVRSVIEAVRRQDAVVGVLPMPAHGEADPWWRLLVTSHPEAPRIIGRLPFVPGGNGRRSHADALMICPVVVAPTGRDRSFLAAEAEERLLPEPFAQALGKAGFAVGFATGWRENERPRAWFVLAEVDGHFQAEDPRLPRLREALSVPLKQLVCLGGYARPIDAGDLGTAPEPASGAITEAGA